jgi:protein tyrosine phosphatase (PTP) superfamily phosphohydrolase (DUF442 family)
MKLLLTISILLLLSATSKSYSSQAGNLADVNKTNFSDSALLDEDKLSKMKNFRQLSTTFASAGMPESSELTTLKQQGYQHIINLIPGDFSDEQQQVNALDISFEQIAVDWQQPALADFERFVELMAEYQQDKVLVHCRLNYRASAFAYLYQTTQLGMDETIAKDQMHSVWQPEGVWLDYISQVQQHYRAK